MTVQFKSRKFGNRSNKFKEMTMKKKQLRELFRDPTTSKFDVVTITRHYLGKMFDSDLKQAVFRYIR